MSRARKVPAGLPDPALPGADWADAFEIDLRDRRLTAIEAARLTLGRMPGWVRGLMAVRNALGRIVGLKTGSEPLEPAFSTIEVTDAHGRRVDAGPARVDAQDRAVLRVPLARIGPGDYTAAWRVVSLDTHATEGHFVFHVVP